VLTLAACGEGDEPAPTPAPDEPDVELDDNGHPVNAHVQPKIGHVPEDAVLDAREGTAPADPAETDLEAAATAGGCDLQTDLPDEGNDHFDEENEPVNYRTNPPTSGDHFADFSETGAGALADGAYLEAPAMSRVVHALEHGRVAIQYSPDLSEGAQLEVKGLFDASPEGVVLMPNADMPYEVAITAWTHLLGCDGFEGAASLDAIAAFREEFRGQGPERLPIAL